MGTRRLGRELALQALYALDLNPMETRRFLLSFWDQNPSPNDARNYAGLLVEGVVAKRTDLDILIKSKAQHWALARMARVDLNLLRLAAYELLYRDDVPKKVIINEAIEIAKKYGSEDSSAFINGILDEIAIPEGISSLSPVDITFAREFGYKIKLLAIGKCDGERIEARIHPTMIPLKYPMADVDGVFNAIRLAGDFVGPVMFIGRGAGMNPTASAVVGELMEISRNILAGIGRRTAPLGYLDGAVVALPLKPMGEIVSKYYLRFSAVDRPKVLSRISGVLGDHGISIESMMQNTRSDQGSVPIVIMTHEAREADVRAAMAEIDTLDIITEKSHLIRIEDNLE